MKMYTKGEKFKPVHIVLETQEEVNQLFSIFNFRPIVDAFHECTFGNLMQTKLSKFKNVDYINFHHQLEFVISRRY